MSVCWRVLFDFSVSFSSIFTLFSMRVILLFVIKYTATFVESNQVSGGLVLALWRWENAENVSFVIIFTVAISPLSA